MLVFGSVDVCVPCPAPAVLNLSHNSIREIPFSFMARVTDLRFLDLSHNQIKTLPVQFRRLKERPVAWRYTIIHARLTLTGLHRGTRRR